MADDLSSQISFSRPVTLNDDDKRRRINDWITCGTPLKVIQEEVSGESETDTDKWASDILLRKVTTIQDTQNTITKSNVNYVSEKYKNESPFIDNEFKSREGIIKYPENNLVEDPLTEDTNIMIQSSHQPDEKLTLTKSFSPDEKSTIIKSPRSVEMITTIKTYAQVEKSIITKSVSQSDTSTTTKAPLKKLTDTRTHSHGKKSPSPCQKSATPKSHLPREKSIILESHTPSEKSATPKSSSPSEKSITQKSSSPVDNDRLSVDGEEEDSSSSSLFDEFFDKSTKKRIIGLTKKISSLEATVSQIQLHNRRLVSPAPNMEKFTQNARLYFPFYWKQILAHRACDS